MLKNRYETEKKRVIDWYNNNEIINPIHITFTHSNDIKKDKIKSSINFKHFLNRINQKIYKNGFKRFNKRLKVFSVFEYDDLTKLHIHSIIEKPSFIKLDKFKDLVRRNWIKTKYGNVHIHFHQPLNDYETNGWKSYILKHRTKSNKLTDYIDWNNVYLNS